MCCWAVFLKEGGIYMRLRKSWLISLAISLFGVLMIEYFFTFQPKDAAENGNLGIVGLAFVVPFLILSLFITYRYALVASREAKDRILRNILLVATIGLICATAYYAWQYKNDVYATLGGTTETQNSTIYGLPILNAYTNRIFFNFYTFIFAHSVSALIGGCVGLFKKQEAADSDEN